MTKRTADLQPWVDYFQMLQVYERHGLIEVVPDKHEIYITLPAICTLCGGIEQIEKKAVETILHLRAYAAWLSQKGQSYMREVFALHIVKDEEPYDLLYTLVVTPRRRWWQNGEKVELIKYNPEKRSG